MHVGHESYIAPHEEDVYIEGGASRFPGNVGNPQLVGPERAKCLRRSRPGTALAARGDLARRVPCRPRSPMSPTDGTTGYVTGTVTLGGLRTTPDLGLESLVAQAPGTMGVSQELEAISTPTPVSTLYTDQIRTPSCGSRRTGRSTRRALTLPTLHKPTRSLRSRWLFATLGPPFQAS